MTGIWPPEGPPKPLKTAYFNYLCATLEVPGPLETWKEALCQILTFGNALRLELGPFLCHVGFHFPNIAYFEVYGGIWEYMKVYEGI